MPETQAVVRIFCSYAREDADFLQAFLRAFSSLNDLVNHNIVAFSDNDIQAGKSIDAVLTDKLQETDILVVIFANTLKKAFAYPGWEVGYFQGLINAELKTTGKTSRSIVSFFLTDPPQIIQSLLGIDMGLDKTELELGREQYLKNVIAELPEDIDKNQFTKFMFEITQLAEKWKPSTINEDERLQRGVNRIAAIKSEVYPRLRSDIFDCISGRIAKDEKEQLLISFELPKRNLSDKAPSIPENAKLICTGRSGTALGGMFIGDKVTSLSWAEFKADIEKLDQPYGNVIHAIEQTVTSAIEAGPVDNDQIIRSPMDTNLYRLIVTEQFEFYDGRRLVNLWLFPFLNFRTFGDKQTSLLLSFIVLAAKYRFLFLEDESPFSIERIRSSENPDELKRTILAVLREVVLIEEEARALGLNTADAFVLIVPKGTPIMLVSQHMKQYDNSRNELQNAASAMISAEPSNAKVFDEVSQRWWSSLDAFIDASRLINTVYTTSALENFKDRFAEDEIGAPE
ncbi:hypothetical protein HFO32_23105 [Rhizobium leguminosarum]|uniref:hypothetical protein n=1 Tax=Rhizobium leguminosarum TaxID=384 RepID=UPI001C948B9E|nr:hypothetical protein [Rhizobium leguminosarum]MBY5672295.1 hypothetical protein [Rhizobium leguminosarum]MBY5684995.1 hypothetical protein [Rhizobium leguminosarum]